MTDYYDDDETTPRPLRVMNLDEPDDRTPYIPRRKSSINDGNQDKGASQITNITRPTSIALVASHRNKYPMVNTRDPRSVSTAGQGETQRPRFPIDGYDPPPGVALYQLPLLAGPRDQRPLLATAPPRTRRILSRMFSTLAFSSNSLKRQSSNSIQSTSNRNPSSRNEFKASSRSNSVQSVNTLDSSLPDNTVRRLRRPSKNTPEIQFPGSPNPLRAPPVSLLGPGNENSSGSDHSESNSDFTTSSVMPLKTPILAFVEVRFRSFPAASSPQNNISSNRVWFVINFTCSLHTTNHQGSLVSDGSNTGGSLSDPGVVQNIVLAVEPMHNCQIVSILGNLTYPVLHPGGKFTVIVLISIDESSFNQGHCPQYRNAYKPKALSLQGRPTSHVLMDQVMKMMKPVPRPKKERVCEDILKVKVSYDHSLFPLGCHIIYEQTLKLPEVIMDTTQWTTHPRQLPTLFKDARYAHEILDHQVVEWMSEDITQVLSEGLHLPEGGAKVSLTRIVDACDAVKLVDDFLAAVPRLDEEARNAIEILSLQYKSLIRSATPNKGSPRRLNLFERKREDKGDDIAKNRPAERRRRNAFELERASVDLEQGLRDITNKTKYRGHDQLDGGRVFQKMNEWVKCAEGQEILQPAPLFSPDKKVESPLKRATSRQNAERIENYDFSHAPVDIGSAAFYEREVEEMARIAFGGAALGNAREKNEVSIQQRTDQSEDKREGDAEAIGWGNDEEGHRKARQIWENIRSTSGNGSVGSSKDTDDGLAGEDSGMDSEQETYLGEEEDSRTRRLAIGAPWLA